MADEYLPPPEFLRECFRYDEATGRLFWRARPLAHFADERIWRLWNAKWADRPAGAVKADGYAFVELMYGTRRCRCAYHRVIFKMLHGYEPETVDHINGDPRDNRPGNLRAATVTENRRNNTGRRKNVLPKAVIFDHNRFYAHVRGPDGQYRRTARFRTPGEAHAAYCAEIRKFHGEFFNPGPARETVFD